VEGYLAKLQREKQALLDQLFGAPQEIVDAVLAPSHGSENDVARLSTSPKPLNLDLASAFQVPCSQVAWWDAVGGNLPWPVQPGGNTGASAPAEQSLHVSIDILDDGSLATNSAPATPTTRAPQTSGDAPLPETVVKDEEQTPGQTRPRWGAGVLSQPGSPAVASTILSSSQEPMEEPGGAVPDRAAFSQPGEHGLGGRAEEQQDTCNPLVEQSFLLDEFATSLATQECTSGSRFSLEASCDAIATPNALAGDQEQNLHEVAVSHGPAVWGMHAASEPQSMSPPAAPSPAVQRSPPSVPCATQLNEHSDLSFSYMPTGQAGTSPTQQRRAGAAVGGCSRQPSGEVAKLAASSPSSSQRFSPRSSGRFVGATRRAGVNQTIGEVELAGAEGRSGSATRMSFAQRMHRRARTSLASKGESEDMNFVLPPGTAGMPDSVEADEPPICTAEDDDDRPLQCLPGMSASSSSGFIPRAVEDDRLAASATESMPESRARKVGADTQWSPKAMTMEELQHWMTFFGLKPAKSTGYMVRCLTEIDDFLKGSSGKRKQPASDEAAPANNRAKRPCRPAEPKGLPKRPKEQGDALVELLVEAIKADTNLYERLLLYEPVEVGEVRKSLANFRPDLAGLGESRLRAVLDAQGILFATTWNNNPRTRNWWRGLWRQSGG